MTTLPRPGSSSSGRNVLPSAGWMPRTWKIFAEARTPRTIAGEPEIVRGVRASANIFQVLGIQPALGRTFLPEEDDPGRGNVVILTAAFWRARFHGDPAVLGATIVLDGVPHQIVGILPSSFRFPAALGGANNTV